MSVDGMFWRCDRCQAPQHTGQREVSKRLLKECPGVKPKVSPSKKKQTAGNGAGTNDATPRTSRGEGELPERDHQAPKAPSIQSFFLKKAPQAEHVQDAGGVPRPGVQAKASGANRKQGQAGRQTKLSFGPTVR